MRLSGLRRPLLRPYERPALAAAAALALAAAILAYPGRAFSPEVPTASAASSTAGHRAPEPLCEDPSKALYLRDRKVGVAADRYGRFALYGGPDPKSGRAVWRSNELLRGCEKRAGNAPPLYLGPISVGVGPPDRPGAVPRTLLGPEDLYAPTRRTPDGLETTYRANGILVTQTLSLVAGRNRIAAAPPARDTLRATYSVLDQSATRRSVDLSVVLAPAKGPQARENSEVPYLAEYPLHHDPPGGVEITSGARLTEDALGIPAEVTVPRPGAAASSTSYWRPLGPPPAEVLFGPAPGLAGAATAGARPLVHAGSSLTEDSAIGFSWTGVTLTPGRARTFSYEYGPTPGWPR